MIKKILEKIKKYGLASFIKGTARSFYIMQLRKKYGFDIWHFSPKEFRPYALDIISYINSHIACDRTVVEIGCGLGEIIRNIKSSRLFGFDADEHVIIAAKKIDKKSRVVFSKGSFQNVKKMNVEYLIAVNFIHELPPSELSMLLKQVCMENSIQNLVVDFVAGEGYQFHHDESIIPPQYSKIYESRVYEHNRIVCIFGK